MEILGRNWLNKKRTEVQTTAPSGSAPPATLFQRRHFILGGSTLLIAGCTGDKSDAPSQSVGNVEPSPEYLLRPAAIESVGTALSSMLYGINLAGAEYADGTYWPSNAIINYYASKGFNLVRLPFKWKRLQPSLSGQLDPTNLAEMARIVTCATGQGMSVALDMHNYMRRGNNGAGSDVIGVTGTGIRAGHYANAWGKIASRFKNNPLVIFNLMNEPHGIDHAISIRNQNAAAAAIRRTGATNLILFSSGHYSGGHQFNYGTEIQSSLELINDPGENWALDIHQYLDPGYAGVSTDVVEGAGGETTMGALTSWARAKGARVILGEFNSGPSSASQREVNRLLAYIAANADVYHGWAWWCGGQAMDNAYHDNDPYMLDPKKTGGADKPQMAVLQAHMPQKASAVPFAPFAARVTLAASGGLVLNYEPGAGATSHQVQVNGGAWTTLETSSATINGLTNDTLATIGLRAVNVNGTSPMVFVSGTPAAPAAWAPFPDATVDLDFAAGQYHGLALGHAISRTGGLTITPGEGLLLQSNVLASAALREFAAQKTGTIMMEVTGLPDSYGGEIWGGIRIDATDAGVAAFFSFERLSWQSHKVKAPAGAPGARQRLMLSWDSTQPTGQRAWMVVSGGMPSNAADNHALDRTNKERFSYVGTHNGTADAVMARSATNPRLRRLCVWSGATLSKSMAKNYTSLAPA